jgi:hypothetical protein
MARAYDVLRKLENGELLQIASRKDEAEAKCLAESLNSYWPAEYIVRDQVSGGEIAVKHGRPANRPEGVHKPEHVI